MKLSVFLLMILFFHSCVTYDYDYKSHETINYIDFYKDPVKNKKYSIGTYISVIGIPITTGVLLGNHTYSNGVNNGSPKDTAAIEKYSIIGLGILAAGIGTYYLYRDTVNQSEQYITTNNDIELWYSHTVDFNQNILLGSYNEGGHSYVLSVNINDTSKIYVDSISQLKSIDKALEFNPRKKYYMKIIADNSISKLSNDNYFYAYDIFGNIGISYLEKAIENADSHIKINQIVSGINNHKLDNPKYYFDLTSKRYRELYKINNYHVINNWLVIFKGISTSKIDQTRNDFKIEKNKLDEEIRKEQERSAKERAEAEEIESKKRNEILAKVKEIENEKKIKEEKEDQILKVEAENIVNNILSKQKKFASQIKEGDCIGIGVMGLDIQRYYKQETTEWQNSFLKNIVVAFETQSGLARNSSDFRRENVINEKYYLEHYFHNCLGQILKIDNKSNEVLIEIINGCKHFESGEKIYMNKSKLIPC